MSYQALNNITYQIILNQLHRKKVKILCIIIMGTTPSVLNKTKITHSGQNQTILYVCSEMQGWRPDMQDAAIYKLSIFHPKPQVHNSLFAVFDGHGTNYVSLLLRQLLVSTLTSLKQYQEEQYEEALLICFQKLDQYIVSEQGQIRLLQIKTIQDSKSLRNRKMPVGQKIGYFCGSTANVVLITQSYYYVANCGDSRSVLCKNNNTIALSRDHKPSDYCQNKRILQAGGFIRRGRVNDTINVARSFGDFQFKKNKHITFQKQIITCLPDIQIVKITKQDQFILIGCDGIWQKCANKSQMLVQYILKTKNYKKKCFSQCLQELLDHLVAKKQTQQLGQDNMTIILINFSH